MPSIRPFLAQPTDFQPELVAAMSQAFEEVCLARGFAPDETREREAVAEKIIDLARAGVRGASELRDQAMGEL